MAQVLIVVLALAAGASAAAQPNAILHSAGLSCFARREDENWVSGPLLHFSQGTESDCRSNCSTVQGTYTAMYVRGTNECYCHGGVRASALPCMERSGVQDCVTFVRRQCYGYGGFSLYGHPETDGNIGPSEYMSRAQSPPFHQASLRDSPRRARVMSGLYSERRCANSEDPFNCWSSASGVDEHCPFEQLDEPSGWCSSSGTRGVLKSCPTHRGLKCNNQGECNSQGVCNCFTGWFGQSCQYKHCPGFETRFAFDLESSSDFAECSGHGVCDYDSGHCHCKCDRVGATPCFFTPDCSEQRCPVANGKECNGQGQCDRKTGKCACNAAYSAADCALPLCGTGETAEAVRTPGSIPTLGRDCNGRGSCTSAGTCYCDEGYWGKFCEEGLGAAAEAAADIPETF